MLVTLSGFTTALPALPALPAACAVYRTALPISLPGMDKAKVGSQALTQGLLTDSPKSYRAIADRRGAAYSTLHDRAHGVRSVEEKARSQQEKSRRLKGCRGQKVTCYRCLSWGLPCASDTYLSIKRPRKGAGSTHVVWLHRYLDNQSRCHTTALSFGATSVPIALAA